MDKSAGTSIIDHFSLLRDPRILLKTRHKLIDIIVITICAVIAGADDWVEISDYGRASKIGSGASWSCQKGFLLMILSDG